MRIEQSTGEAIIVDLVNRVEGNMKLDTANGPEDIIVTEMLKGLPIGLNFVITKWFQRTFRGDCDSLAS